MSIVQKRGNCGRSKRWRDLAIFNIKFSQKKWSGRRSEQKDYIDKKKARGKNTQHLVTEEKSGEGGGVSTFTVSL
jgi:hypothetical protein